MKLFAITEGGHPYNGYIYEIELNVYELHQLDNQDIELSNEDWVLKSDPMFSNLEAFKRYYGDDESFYQDFLSRYQVKRKLGIDIAEQVWDVVQQNATHQSVLVDQFLTKENIMAKREKKTSSDQTPPKKDGRQEFRSKVRSTTEVTLLRKHDPEKDEKLAKQAVHILHTLDTLGGKATRTDLIAKMPEFVKTVQSHDKIFQHYRGQLVDRGYIKIDEKRFEQNESPEAA